MIINTGILDGVRRVGARVRNLTIEGGLPGVPLGFRMWGATTSGAPVTGSWKAGDTVEDRNGTFWVCTIAGTPGSWVQSGRPAAWQPQDHGFKAWAYDIALGGSSVTLTAATGQIYMVGLQLPVAVTVSNLYVCVTTAATSVTNAQIGLYSPAGTLLVASSFTSGAGSIASVTFGAIPCTPTPCAPGLVWLSFFYTGTGTSAVMPRGAAPGAGASNANLAATASRYGQYTIAEPYSSLPSSITPSSISQLSSTIWGAVS